MNWHHQVPSPLNMNWSQAQYLNMSNGNLPNVGWNPYSQMNFRQSQPNVMIMHQQQGVNMNRPQSWNNGNVNQRKWKGGKRKFQNNQQQGEHVTNEPANKRRKKNDGKVGTPKAAKSNDGFISIQDVPENLSYLDKLSRVIWHNFINNRQSDSTYNKKMAVRNFLCTILEDFGPNCVHIVGSSLNGFGSEKSDCDMCLHITSNENQLTNRLTQTILIAVQQGLQASHRFYDIQYIPARVPILKFKDRISGIECDLNVNNTAGLLNTRLLALYCHFDWRVRPLGMFVKHWGRMCDIHDASRGRLSSYAFNLMFIQFLQHGCSPPILPSLQENYQHLFNRSHDGMRHLDMGTSEIQSVIADWRHRCPLNNESLGQLFVGFINYCMGIDYNKEALSVRKGKPIPLSLALQQLPQDEARRIQRGYYNYKMFMEEPFTLMNASRSPFDESVYAIVKRAFIKTSRFLKLRKDINDVVPI